MDKIISGIQQIGIGVTDITEAWKWYRTYFGMNICIFEEKAVAEYMLHYTEGEPRGRHAILAMNIQGGGGFEIWQHTDKEPNVRTAQCLLGDLGINICKIKTENIAKVYKFFKDSKLNVISEIYTSPENQKHFLVKDPWDNTFQFIEHPYIFHKSKDLSGGVFGAIIGVTDIDKAMKVYKEILSYETVVYDISGKFDDFNGLKGGGQEFRRALLRHSEMRKGAFSELLGPTEIELISVLNREPSKIYHGRMWGDPGFIHLCFDIVGFEQLKTECFGKGFPFTVDSTIQQENTFDMGEAAGDFAYISDTDGTPIEFVETKKIPVIKKIGWYLNIAGRNPEKPLPRWILKSLRFQKKK